MADIAVHLTAVAPLPMREALERTPSSPDNQVLPRMAEKTTAITALRGAIPWLYRRTATPTPRNQAVAARMIATLPAQGEQP